MVLALLGVGLGVTAALPLARPMSGLLYGVSSNDPLTLTGVSPLLAGVAPGGQLLPCSQSREGRSGGGTAT